MVHTVVPCRIHAYSALQINERMIQKKCKVYNQGMEVGE